MMENYLHFHVTLPLLLLLLLDLSILKKLFNLRICNKDKNQTLFSYLRSSIVILPRVQGPAAPPAAAPPAPPPRRRLPSQPQASASPWT